METTAKTKVREWYTKTYPHDTLARSIAENITFEDVFETLDRRKDVYKTLGVGDSIIRENVFAELAAIMEVDYDHIYDQWLLCDDDEENIILQNNKIAYYTCPECQEEALRYAMIDIDGTNLEEGYSCGECGTNFIGLDNQEVIELNPEITTDDE